MNDNDNKRKLYDALSNEYDLGTFEQFASDVEDEGKRQKLYDAIKEEYDLPDFDGFTNQLVGVRSQPAIGAEQSPQRNIEKRAPRETYQQATNGMPVYEPGASVQTTVRKPEEVKTASSVPARKKRQEVKPVVNGSEQTEPSITEKMDNVRRNVNPQAYFDVYGRTGVRAPFATAEATAEYDNQRPEVQLQRRLTGYGKDFSTSAESAWNTAMENTAQEQGENIKMISRTGGLMPGGSGMGQLALINKAARLRNTDMEVMTSNAWEALGKEKQDAIVNDYYQQLIREQAKNAGEGAGESTMSQEDAERILREQAEQMAKARQWQAMYDKAVEMNAPKDVRDFMFRKIVEGNTISKLVTGAARVMAGTRGDLEARDVAMQNYEKDGHKVAGIAGSVLAIATDPVTYVSGGAGGAVTKAVAEGVGKAAVSQGIKQGTRTLAGRVIENTLPRVAGGATNFALFEGLNNAVEQARMGGVYDPETGEYTYDMGEIGKAAGHGVLLGAASGVAGGLIGNVGDKIYKNIKSTAGKVGERIGEAVVSDAAMGTIFAAPELISGEGDFDTWLDNVEMMVGFRLSHGAKAIPQRFEQLRRNPESRAGFETRLRQMLDNRPDLALTKDEAKELNDAGYKDLKELVEAYKSTDGKLVVRGEELPYNRFEELMNDDRVSKAAKAKMYYYVTGKLLPEPTVLSVNLDPILDADGKPQGYVVESKNEKGEVVTRRNYRSENEANVEFERLGRQAELNSIEMLELLYDKMSTDGTTSKMLRDVIGKEYKVDIDKAIGKEPNRRSDSEKKAIEEYTRTMLKDGYEAWEMSQRDAARKQIEGPYKRGYEADEQGRRDITIEAANGDIEAEEAVAGVKQRIEDDADAMVEREREAFNLQRNDEDGALHPATMTVDGEEREVYIKSGNVVLDASGSIDVSNSGETIVVYDPVQGKNVMVSPQDLGGVGEVVTVEQFEAGLQAQREAYVQQQQDAATGRFNPQPGQQIEIPEAGMATVLATDGESVTLQMPDGTQQSMAIADIQSIVDAMSMEDYRQRHPEAAAPAADEGQPGGIREGVPEAFEPDMDVLINEEGQDKVLRYIGRARLVDAKGKVYEPDEEGSFLAFYDPTAEGQARYVNTKYKEEYDAFLQKVVGYKPAEQEEAEQPAEPAAAVEPEEAPVEEQPGESVQQEEEAAPAGESAEAAAASAAEVNPMPMKTVGTGKNKREEEDWYATTPERAYQYLYEEAVGLGLPVETADNMVAKNLEKAQQAVERAKTATGSVVSVLQKQKAAQAAVEYWEQVASMRQAVVDAEKAEAAAQRRAELEEQQRKDAERHDAAVAQQQADYEARKQAEAEREAVGKENPMPQITEKWNNAEKVDGFKDELVLPNGESVKGHYVLHESGASSPSHNSETWKPTEGFPMDVNNGTVNDRDYERSEKAQEYTRQMAANFDQRALQTPVFVSADGVVLSGNGRTMAGEIAARNNSDGAYINYLREYAHKYGFTPEQVDAMQHPRVSFVPDARMPYTVDTFAKFNGKDTKSQDDAEEAIKLGKLVSDDTYGRIVNIIRGYDTLGEFYNDPKATAPILREFINNGVITEAELAKMETGPAGNKKLSVQGRDILENALTGKIFASNPDVVKMLVEMPAVKQKIVAALAELADNAALGEKYALNDILTDAVKLVYDAKVNFGVKDGDIVSVHSKQYEMFKDPDQMETAADVQNGAMLMLADMLNGKGVNNIKERIELYNDEARQAAAGQIDLFGGGQPRSREEMLKDVINNYNHATRKQREAARTAAVERRKGASSNEAGTADESRPESQREGTGEREAEQPAGSPIAESIASQEVNGNPSEAQKEAGNYKKAHVKVDGFDVTIENKKGGTRSGVDPNGKAWSQTMHNDYGYILGTEGVDGDHIDLFLSDTPEQGDVFVVDQVNADGNFDEHKVMYGFPDMESARQAYLSNYEEGWQGLGAITPVSKEEFKKWVESSHRKTKPFSEYKSVKTEGDVLVERQPSTAEDVEAGGAVVDKLQDMGVEVSTDIAENRRVRKQAEQDNSESGKIHNLKTSDGKVYGFAYRGKLYLDPRKIDAELPLHEYGHLWTEAFRILNPEGWKDIVETIKQDSKGWEMVKELYPDLKSDSEIADEVIATFSGKNGAERLKAELERMAAKNPEYKSRWGNIYQNIVKAIQDFWKKVGDFLGIKYETPEQVYDQVLRDFAAGMNPRARVEKYLKERDAEYMNAVESGDEVKAKELFDAALRENIGNGMTPYLSVDSYIGRLKNLVKRVKSRDPQVILQVAELMAPLIPQDAVLVPAPSHTGKATDMLDLAKALSRITGAPVANVLHGVERESQYLVKKEGGRPLTADQMGIVMDGTLPDGKIPVVIDNVVDSGNTAEACVKALGKGIVVSLAEGVNRRKHAATLKSANVVARDRSGNIVPLSRRFDLDGVNYLAKQKGDGKVQKPTKEQKVMVRSLVDLLNEMGVPAHLTVKEGQAALDKYRELVRALRAYHGSGADFDRFDHSHMGEGEGAQAYGYGTYVTEVEGIGRKYAESLGKNLVRYIGKEYMPLYLQKTVERMLSSGRKLDDIKQSIAKTRDMYNDDYKNYPDHEKEERTRRYNEAVKYLENVTEKDFVEDGGHYIYTVDIPDDNGHNYLDWVRTISKSDRRRIADVVRRLDGEPAESVKYPKYTGGWQQLADMFERNQWAYQEVRDRLVQAFGGRIADEKRVSDLMHSAGFVGVKYPAGFRSGGRSDGAKNYVIFDENDIKIVDKIRFHKAEGGEYVPEMKPVFYSNAMKAVEGIKQEKATPEQWFKMIEKAGGLKAGEDKWTGLSEWLKGSDKKSLTKQEVMDYLRENAIEIEEVEYGDIAKSKEFDKMQKVFRSLYRQTAGIDPRTKVDNAFGQLSAMYNGGDDFSMAFSPEAYFYKNGKLQVNLIINDDDAAAYFLGDKKPINSTRLSYTTKGLDNKREIALTVPTIESWNESDVIHFGDAGEGRAVAWVRFGETTDADGNRVLVIDEIQSKRHQKGREKGYKTNGAQDAVTKSNIKRIEAQSSYDLYVSDLAKKYDCERDDIYSYANDAEITQVEEYKKAVENAEASYEKAYQENNGVPNAPFDKNWHELAMKRMLRYAAENGYDKVAWTTGEQQAERYDLSKSIKDMTATGWTDYSALRGDEAKDTKLIAINTIDGGEYTQLLVDKNGKVLSDVDDQFVGRQLSDIVGKDLAKRLMEDGYQTIEGEGLRVGGEGMNGFYDQILPRFVDKYTKKWGVKTTDINLPNIGDNGLTMHSVDVTPEMKADVMEGQPMFFKTPEGEVYGFTLGGEIYIDPRYAKPETPIHEYTHLWAQALRDSNPTAWARLKEEMKGVDGGRLWDYVQRRYPELKNEDELVEEVFAHYSGKRGAERLEKDMREEMKKANGIFEKAHVANIFHKLRRLLHRFWKMARDLFAGKVEGVERLTAEDFADMALGDLMNGFNPSVKRKVESGKRDAEYMAAVERGDMETAQRMVDAEARRKGYISESDFRMSHTAPNGRDGFSKSIDDVSGIYPEDLYSPNGYHYYGDGEVWMDRVSANVFSRVRNNPDALVKIYRAVPKSLKETKLRNGDWVSINREYAREHGERNIDGAYKIIEDEVPAKYVYTDGNSLHEQGYDDGGNYAYQNTKNNRKLLDAVTYDDDGKVIPLSKRFDKRNADVRFQKGGTYRTKDGVQLSMMSLFEEGEESGKREVESGKQDAGDLSELRLRKLAPGETCLVERRYEENKQFSFTGSEKIESMDDVAYIFKQLEDAAVENVFLALVKDGKPTVIHIGMGTYAQSSLDFRLAFAAYKDIQPDAVYVVHNHPSGALKASKEDRNMLYNAKMYFGNDVVKDGIIIDTVSGKYGVFGFVGERENAMPESADHEVSVKTYEFSKQVFNEDWNPEEATQFADSEDIAAFISSQRLGEHPKMSFIVVNNQYQVVGNYFLPWTSISEIDDFKAAADELSNYVQLSGGTRGILYGNYQYDNADKRNLQKLAAGMKSVGTPLTDVLHIDIHDELGYHSANDSEELTPEKEYEAPKREAGEDYLSYAKRIVEDRNAYEAIVKAYEAFNSGVAESQVNDPGVEEILNDGRMGMREKITATAIKIANEQRDNMELRNNAVRAIGGNLMDIRKAMSLQREYDKGTVKRVADLVRVLVKGGYLEGATNGEISRILSIVKNATGKSDITGDIRKLMEIMVDSQLRRAEDMLREVESIKGSKVDAKGVEVQGKLDVAGQQVMKTFKETRGYSEDELAEALAEAENRMGSDDAAVAEEAANVRAGLLLSQYYEQNIRSSKTEERELKLQLDDARHATDRSLEFENTILESIQQNRVERLEAYNELMNMLGETLQKSVDAAKEFNDAVKERVREIQHNANSDMAGRPAKEHIKAPSFMQKTGNVLADTLLSPLQTFNEMMRLFGSKSANGEGYLYNRFVRGMVDARQKEVRGVRGKYAVLDAKVKSLFGKDAKNMADLIHLVGKMPKATVLFKNGGELEEFKVTQGNLMYIYMVNKMLDGRMKLRKMGIDEKAINEVMRILDPRLMELADWMQEDFLVDSRNEYNETHKRIFGAPMAAIEHYFPLKINPNARVDKAEDLDDFDKNEGISTKTGSIIKRRRNALALDILNADALEVILDHVTKMEHWNAFAEYNRDLNTLRTYAHFRNQVLNMNTIYGNGKNLWENFNNVCQLVTGSYRPKQAKSEKIALGVAQKVSAAKVAFRINTALKQLLSLPAYLPYINAKGFYKSIANNISNKGTSFKWCMENLPMFEERWKSRVSGDPKLAKSVMDWQSRHANFVQKLGRLGMLPNAAIDALTVSIGAHAVYETRRDAYLKEGYSKEDAEKRAIQDAEIAYNETQQSSEGGFVSTLQSDHTWLSTIFSVFRVASMGYTRRVVDAARNIAHNLTPSQRKSTIDFMTKQLVRDGIPEDKADDAAKARFNRNMRMNYIALATFGYIVEFAWNFGNKMWYLIFGDDDDKKKDMWDDIWVQSMFGSIEGLAGGDVMSELGRQVVRGDFNPRTLEKDMPISSDILRLIEKVGYQKYDEAINDMINLAVQMAVGVNPQSISDFVLSVTDICGGDITLAHEATIFAARFVNAPQSQIKDLYFDEIGMTGEEASKYTPQQLAERYAKYQVKRGRLIEPWTWADEEALNKQEKKANEAIKERVDALGGSKVNKAYEQYEEQYKDYYAKVKEYRASSEYKDATPLEKAQWLTELYKEDPQGYAVYSSFKNMDAMLDKMAKYYLASSTPQEAQACHKYIEEYKQAMVDVLGAESDEERTSARKRRNDCVERFYSEVGNLQKTRTKEEKMWKEYQKQMQKTVKDEYSADSMLR